MAARATKAVARVGAVRGVGRWEPCEDDLIAVRDAFEWDWHCIVTRSLIVCHIEDHLRRRGVASNAEASNMSA